MPKSHNAPLTRPGKRTKRRHCIKCEREFPSVGPSNRLCPECNAANARLPRILSMPPVPESQ